MANVAWKIQTGSKKEGKKEGNSVKDVDGTEGDFSLLCVVLCLLAFLIFDICLALFFAWPSLASPFF